MKRKDNVSLPGNIRLNNKKTEVYRFSVSEPPFETDKAITSAWKKESQFKQHSLFFNKIHCVEKIMKINTK